MRHITKILAGVAAFLIMSGGLLAIAGWAMGAETDQRFNVHGYEFYVGHQGAIISGAESSPLPGNGMSDGARNMEAFTGINIVVALTDVEFQHADDYGVYLEWHYDRAAIEYECSDGRLTVWMPREGNFNVNGSYREGKVIVYLPEDAKLRDVTIYNSMSDITMAGYSMDSLNVSNSMGAVELSGLRADTMDLENSMGDVTAKSCNVSDSIYVSNSMADILLTGDLRGNITLENSMGAIELRTSVGRSEFGYDLDTSMSTVRVDGEDFDENTSKRGGSSYLTASNSMGDIDIFFGR